MTRAARLLLPLLLALAPAARAEQAGVLHSDPALAVRDAAAAGALVWLHPHAREAPAPPPPDWTAGLVAAGWDLWLWDRAGPAEVPLRAGAQRLAEATAALRARGYRRVAVLGESRGAFIALAALRHAGLADAVVLAAPAAHGRRPERREEALADFSAALRAADPAATRRLAVFLFDDDGWDPDPAGRAMMARDALARLGIQGLVVDRPAAPTGHGGLQDPGFAPRFLGCVAALLDLDAPPPAACP